MLKNKEIVVWFSCGAASAVAAKLTLEKYGNDNNVRIVNNPVVEEHEDNIRFLHDVEKWLGVTIETCINPKYPNCSAVEVWDKRRYMAGVSGAPCTMELKKGARQYFEKNNHIDYHVLGFTVDERKRAERFKLTERDNLLDVLIDANLTKNDCFNILVKEGLDLPSIYKMGFPNANCIGCVKAASPTYWNLVRDKFPDIFNDRMIQSEIIGAKLVKVKGKRIPLRELSPNDMGRPLKSMVIDCGIFCEESELKMEE